MADSNIEYAIRRIADQAYLWDDDLDGRYVSWEDDEDNASWLDTEALALNLAELDGVAHEGADGPVLDEGFEVVSRQWRYEEDWTEEDWTSPETQGRPPRNPKPDTGPRWWFRPGVAGRPSALFGQIS